VSYLNFYCWLLILFLIPAASLDLQGCDNKPFAELKNAQEVTLAGPFRYKYKRFISLYDITLRKPKGTDPSQIFNGEHPFSIDFEYLRRIKKAIIIKSASITLNNNLDLEALPELAKQVTELHAKYVSVNKKDRSQFIYCPDHGTEFYINGALVHTIPGKQFAQLYFKIWFGERPISRKMKEDLLDF
jgi:hypothetical protein